MSSLLGKTKLIKVRVIPGAKKELVEEIEPGFLKVKVQDPPEKGKANARVIELLAEYFNVTESQVVLKHGAKSSDKVFVIMYNR